MRGGRSPKQQKTRDRRILRTKEELEEGQRHPCCLYAVDEAVIEPIKTYQFPVTAVDDEYG